MSKPIYRLIVNCDDGADLASLVTDMGLWIERKLENGELLGNAAAFAETVLPFDMEEENDDE